MPRIALSWNKVYEVKRMRRYQPLSLSSTLGLYSYIHTQCNNFFPVIQFRFLERKLYGEITRDPFFNKATIVH